MKAAFDRTKAVALASDLLGRGTGDPRVVSVSIDYRDHGAFEVQINDGNLSDKQIAAIVFVAAKYETSFRYVEGNWIAGRDD